LLSLSLFLDVRRGRFLGTIVLHGGTDRTIFYFEIKISSHRNDRCMNSALLLEKEQLFWAHMAIALVGRNKCLSQRMFRVNAINDGQLAEGHQKLSIGSRGKRQ